MNEEGGKLIAFLVIGIVLLIFVAFLPSLLDSKEKPVLKDCGEIYSLCLESCSSDISGILSCEAQCKINYDTCSGVENEKVSEVPDGGLPTVLKCDPCTQNNFVNTEYPECKCVCSIESCGEDEELVTTHDGCSCEKIKVVETKAISTLSDLLYDLAIPFALLISYLIVALAFMASKVFSSREAETWAKIELREVLISTVYALLILSFFPFFNVLIDEFSKTYNGVPHEKMFEQLLDTSFKPIQSTIQYLFTFSTLNWIGWTPSAVGGILPYAPPIPPLSSPSAVHISSSYIYDGKSFLNFFSLFAHTFIPIVFSAMVSIMGQIVILNFFEKTLFIFVGLALALRSFTFTRKMGGTLLAVILGVFFLFKLLLVIESSVYLNMGLDQSLTLEGGAALDFLDTISEGVPLLMDGLLGLLDVSNFPMYFYSFVKDCMDGNYLLMVLCILIAPIIWLIDLIIAIGKLIAGILTWAFALLAVTLMGVVTLTDAVNSVIVGSIALYSDVMVFALFMPVLNFIIIIAGVKCLAETFGGDVSVVNMLTFI